MEKGRGGVGTAKHRISGHAGIGPKERLRRQLEATRVDAEKSNRISQKWFRSVAEAIDAAVTKREKMSRRTP